MARPIKEGLDYSPQDTDIHCDKKIKKLLREFGAKGYLIYDYVKAQCYKENGYWVKFDDEFCFDVSDALQSAGVTEELTMEVLQGCIRLCLFNKRVFDMFQIITSSGIQKRYLRIKRNPVIINDYRVNTEETEIISTETGINVAETGINVAESTQSKVKKSKEKIKPNGFIPNEEQEKSFEKFQQWLKDELPEVFKMPKPFTLNEYITLLGEMPDKTSATGFKSGISKKEIIAYLQTIENNKEYLKKFRSPYLCVLAWHRKDKNR